MVALSTVGRCTPEATLSDAISAAGTDAAAAAES